MADYAIFKRNFDDRPTEAISYKIVEDKDHVPRAVRIMYWTDLLMTGFCDVPVFGIRSLQHWFLPMHVLTPELRLIAQGKALSNAVQTTVLWYIGTHHAPSTPLGKLCAWLTTIYHLLSAFLAFRYGYMQNGFKRSLDAVIFHSSMTVLGAYTLWLAYYRPRYKSIEVTGNGTMRMVSPRPASQSAEIKTPRTVPTDVSKQFVGEISDPMTDPHSPDQGPSRKRRQRSRSKR